jgi:hypothetical protein
MPRFDDPTLTKFTLDCGAACDAACSRSAPTTVATNRLTLDGLLPASYIRAKTRAAWNSLQAQPHVLCKSKELLADQLIEADARLMMQLKKVTERLGDLDLMRSANPGIFQASVFEKERVTAIRQGQLIAGGIKEIQTRQAQQQQAQRIQQAQDAQDGLVMLNSDAERYKKAIQATLVDITTAAYGATVQLWYGFDRSGKKCERSARAAAQAAYKELTRGVKHQ